MKYISTRGNQLPVTSAHAINLGMVPEGGLFIPESIPPLDKLDTNNTYNETAYRVLSPFLNDFSESEVRKCIDSAYNKTTFDIPDIIGLKDIGNNRSILELWHGPTAAFKDMALQIMPHFLQLSKQKINNTSHTVILVATSGDTGKAALEGFKDCEGISIIVFYPHGGVSEIQRLQMETTGGKNTYVVAVKGNFDDCQTGVKNLFSDISLRKSIESEGFEFSSANSINWGRLCPQIIYYYQTYLKLVEKRKISYGDPIDICVPTGNFGNILAAYYAKMMGLPVRKLICASNRNNILTDFFSTGIYDRNREFFKTASPSMDILISSNLERFLAEIAGHNASMVRNLYSSLGSSGKFAIDQITKEKLDEFVTAGWVDEDTVFKTIANTYKSNGYVIDTHTAVAAAVLDSKGSSDIHTVITSTASPYKFSCDVLRALEGVSCDDEFEAISRISKLSGTPVHRAVADLKDKKLTHNNVIEIPQMKTTVENIIRSIRK